jgi:3-oxoacyl-[acyl-carrier protein] reductase
MTQSGGGSIVFVSSVNGLTGIGLTSYSAAKSGIFGLSRVIATHYGRHGVRSNVLCPGTIQSENLAEKRAQEWSEEQWEEWINQYPLGRFGRPDEVADAALFLGSDRSSFVTGQKLILDGGLTAGLSQSLLKQMYSICEPLS